MNHECRLWVALEQQQQQQQEEEEAAFHHQAIRTPPTPSSGSLSQTSRGGSRAPSPLRPAAATKPMRTGRGSGNKDRHSKVQTARGPRDRRVRLSVSTAIQFYDIQDRLGFDQPSKAIEWLLKMAKPAIDELYHTPAAAEAAAAAKAVGSVSKQEQNEEPEAEEETQEQPPATDMVRFESTAAAAAVEQEHLKVEQATATAGNLSGGSSSRMLTRSQVSFTQLLQAPISAEILPQQHSLFRSPQFFATLSQQSPSPLPPPPRQCFGSSEQNVQQQQQQQQESRHFHHQQQHRHHVAAELAGAAGVQKYYSAEIDQHQQQQEVPRHSRATSLSSLSASSRHHLHLQQQQHHPQQQQQQQEHGWKHFDGRHQAQQLLPAPGPSLSFRRMIPARIQGLEGIDEQLLQQQDQR